MIKRVTLVIGSVLLLSGCTASVGELAMAAPERVGAPTKVLRRGISGEACTHKVFGIPFSERAPDLNAAVEAAVAKVPGGVMLTDVAIQNDYVITFVYNQNCIRVTGDVVGN
jgi:hypothetical protein